MTMVQLYLHGTCHCGHQQAWVCEVPKDEANMAAFNAQPRCGKCQKVVGRFDWKILPINEEPAQAKNELERS